MRIKIKPRTRQVIKEDENSLLIEPIPDEPEFYKVHKSLIEDLFETSELIAENGHVGITDPEKWCEERGYYALRNLLTKINAIQQAAKGKFGT